MIWWTASLDLTCAHCASDCKNLKILEEFTKTILCPETGLFLVSVENGLNLENFKIVLTSLFKFFFYCRTFGNVK